MGARVKALDLYFDLLVWRTYDYGLVHSTLTRDELWGTIAEDGQDVANFRPEMNNECWLAMATQRGDLVAIYNLHPLNGATLQIHAHVLPEYRQRLSLNTGQAALRWIIEHAPAFYEKVEAVIPVIYPNVSRFTQQFGFRKEGISRRSYRKGGEVVDQVRLGITRDEIVVYLNEQSGQINLRRDGQVRPEAASGKSGRSEGVCQGATG